MTPPTTDLTALARPRGAASTGDAAAPTSGIARPRPRWVTRWGIPGGIVSLAFVLFVYVSADALWPATDVRIVKVVAKSGVGGTAAATVQAPGWVEADPYPTVVSALADGVVAEVLALEGARIKAGDVVARLIPDDARIGLEKAAAELAERESALRFAEATLEAAQREWDNPVELTRRVASAEAALAEREAELHRWPSELAAAQAVAAELGAECARIERLHADKQASEIEFIRATQRCESQRATVASIEARRPILQAQLDAARAELAAAKENLRLRIPEKRALDEARAAVASAHAAVDRARAARDEARLRLERMEVRSSVAGVVMTRLVEPGSKVMQATDNPMSSHVVRLYDPGRLQVRVDVPLAEAAQVSIGQDAEVVVNVLPDRVFRGRVTRVLHEADIQKNTLQVKVAITDPAAELKPEMLAHVRFLSTDSATGASSDLSVFAPEAVIRRDDGGNPYVWLVDSSARRAQRRAIKLGTAKQDGWVQVAEGLQPGDSLIVDPPASLRDGARIRATGDTRSKQ